MERTDESLKRINNIKSLKKVLIIDIENTKRKSSRIE